MLEHENVIRPDVWKKSRGVTRVIELPSGQSVRIRELNPLQLLRSNMENSGELAASIFSLITKADKSGEIAISKITNSEVPKFIKIMESYFLEAVIEPRIVTDRKDETEDSIFFGDVDTADIMFLFESFGESTKTAQLKREESKKNKQFFRGESGSNPTDGRGGPEVRAETKPDVVDPESDGGVKI